MPIQKVTKEEIIQKAFEQFVNFGYHETSISDLAKACGIKNALFYYYFTNKEDLMAEVLKFTKESIVNKFNKLIEDQSISAKEKLEKTTQYIEKVFSKYPGGCIMANTTLGTAFLETRFAEIIKQFFDIWIEVLTKLFLSKYQQEKAKELAEATVQDIEGGIMLMKLYRDSKYLLNALKRCVKQLD